MQEKYNDRIRIQDGNIIPELVQNGLKAICLCVFGTNRSPNCALFLRNVGIPSVYAVGGLNALANVDAKTRSIFFDYATEAENLIFVLDSFDYEDYQSILSEIVRKKGKIIISDNFNQIRKTYFPDQRN